MQINSDPIHFEPSSPDEPGTPIASEVPVETAHGEWINKDGITSVSQVKTSNYLSLANIVQHFFSFLEGITARFFSYQSKNSSANEGKHLNKEISPENGLPIASATIVVRSTEIDRHEIGQILKDVFQQASSSPRRATNDSTYDHYVHFCDEVLFYRDHLSASTVQHAEQLQRAASTLKEKPPIDKMTKSTTSILWNSATKRFAEPEAAAAAPNLKAELGSEAFKELQTLMDTARKHNNGDLSSLNLSDKKFDPLFEKKFDALRAGLGIKLRPQDVEKRQDPLEQFNNSLKLLHDDLQKDLGIDLFE